MAKRPCAEPGCPTLGTTTRCPAHTKTTTERGYGSQHQIERAKWQRIVDRTGWPCARCETRIQPGDDWHLDHSDDRTTYLGPSHARCNDSAGGKARHREQQ
jgi:hypothetical protein